MDLFNGFDPGEEERQDNKDPPDHTELTAAPWKQKEHPSHTYRPYAGVGSRSTPDEVMEKMADLARVLGDAGWTLRSGGADGADFAFEWGVGLSSGYREIYLPTSGWNGSRGPHCHTPPDLAFAAARKAWRPYAERTGVSPWPDLKPFTKRLMARNVCQVCGHDLDCNANFVVCWTPDGVTAGPETTPETGGTEMAIRIASMADVPVFNLALEDHRKRVDEILPVESHTDSD